jgi:uncharacterized membrane protein
MTMMTVWRFSDPTDVDVAENELLSLQARGVLAVLDGAVVSWPREYRRPAIRQLRNSTGVSTFGTAFWGLLFGITFYVPVIGAALGAAVGTLLTGSMTSVGVDHSFIDDIRRRITPGTSALFLLGDNLVIDKISHAFNGRLSTELLQTNLSSEQAARLRETFSERA